ncbi:SAM-dependent methyltransferase [Reticulibacter mediterranei]|uniref:SAM-dependent methyltransferase n=1 Tax=Reticulibacter mediterranei TaxID=2778369 RepID=A0A8J3IF17_9CHLR|nr:methyltransferase domain-containing protein [Reticulibacter mediterranei]GHO93206.1 SAM-dependent methyltransferase [Reticulibacter mediterranei]
MPSYPVVLSYIQAEILLTAYRQGKTSVEVSPDLNISTVTVALSDHGVAFPRGELVNWQQVEQIRKANVNCFLVEGNEIRSIQVFSEQTSRMCSLMPTKQTPTMLIAGFTMHRIVDIDPMQDTRAKIAAITPVVGRVLDTATGLGYTAIAAAKTAEQVVTIELDPGAQKMARLNPWSRGLFENPKIQQLMGDAYEVVPTFGDESFDRIIHDPPVFSLAGELYSGVFYRELYRILKRRGRLFHYIGNLDSKSSGTVVRGALKRLQEAGFKRVVRKPEAFGVVAYK